MRKPMKGGNILLRARLRKCLSVFILAVLFLSALSSVSMAAKSVDVKKDSSEITNEPLIPDVEENSLKSVTLQPDEVTSKDAWITNISVGIGDNYGESEELFVGNSGGSEWRSLVQFDLPDDMGELEYASLKLYSYVNGGQTDVIVHAVSNHWDEGTGTETPDMAVNWTHRTNEEPWNAVDGGGDFYSSPYSSRTCDLNTLWYDWNVTGMVERWNSGIWENNGFILMPSEFKTGDNYLGFHSSNAEDPSLYPKLVLSYAPFPDQYMEMNDPPEEIDMSEKGYGPVVNRSGPMEGDTSYPFGGDLYDQLHYQSVFTPEQVGSQGPISRLSIPRATLDTGTFSNFEISMAHTELFDLTDTFDSNYVGNLIEVFSEGNVEVNSSDGDHWVHFDLNSSFIYDSSYNLLVDIQWIGDGGTTIQSYVSLDSGVKRIWATTDSDTGVTNSNRPVFKFTMDVLHGSVLDGGSSRIIHPFWVTEDYAKMQMLYTADQLSGREGVIDRLSFFRDEVSTGESTFPNLTISLTHTSIDSLTENFEDNFDDELVEVYSVPSYTFEGGYGWVDIDVDNVFEYNGEENLLLELVWEGSASGDFVSLGYGIYGTEYNSLYNYSDSSTGDLSVRSYNIRMIFENEWEAQSMDMNLFEAEVDGQTLTITPRNNARGIGTMELTMGNGYPGPLTREITVNIGLKDTFITDHGPNQYNNHGGLDSMYSGPFMDDTELRSLLEFNLPAEEGVLERASVSIYCSYIEISGEGVNVSLYPITNPWLENDLRYEEGDANWYNRTTDTAWDTPGGDFDTSYSSYRNISQNGIWYDFDITEIAEAWYQGDLDNNGLMITGEYVDPSTFNYVGFYTSDYPSDEYWPKISISFGSEKVPDQVMEEDEPTRTVPLGQDYGVFESITGFSSSMSSVPFDGEFENECHLQSLYTPVMVGPEGEIKRISFKRSHPSVVGTFDDLTVSLAHTELTELTSTFDDNYHGFLTEVYSADRYETNSSDGDEWIHFELDETFTYDSQYNLLLDIQWQGDDAVTVYVEASQSLDYDRQLYSYDITSATGTLQWNRLNVVKFETEAKDNTVLGQGIGSNYYPFAPNEVDWIKSQMLYKSDSINSSGTIDRISFQAYQESLDWAVVENITIRMAHSQNETLSEDFSAHNIDPWVEVMNRSRFNVSTAGRPEWIVFYIDETFEYNGVDNLVIDIRWEGGYASDQGVNLAVSYVGYNSRLVESPFVKVADTINYNVNIDFLDSPQWEAVSSDPSLFTVDVNGSYGLEITPQPDQYGSGTIDLLMRNPNGDLLDQQTVGVTILAVNDPPELSGVPTEIECIAGVDFLLDMSLYASDVDNTLDELNFTTDSSYAVVDGYNITFNYGSGVLDEVVNVTVEDPEGLSDYSLVNVTVKHPPVLEVVDPVECVEGVDYVLDLSAYVTDEDNTLDELTFTTDSSYAAVDGYEVTFNYPSGVLDEVVNVTVEDPEGLSDYSLVDVTVKHPPVLSDVPSEIECEVGVEYELDMSLYVTDEDNVLSELTFYTDSSYATVDGSTIIFYYPGDVMSEVVNVTVEDPDGLTDHSMVDVTVTGEPNEPPVISGLPSNIQCTVDVDYVLDMSLYASDPDNDLMELVFYTDSSYATVDGYEITFNYPDGVDSETVVITVEDPLGLTDEGIVEVTVNLINEPPEISGVPSEIDCVEDEDYVLDMSSYVTDPDNDLSELFFTVDSSYASVDGHLITFNYHGGVTEEQVTITVEDPEGLTDTTVIDVSVTLVWEYPNIVTSGPSGADVTFDENIVVEFSMSMDTDAVESAFSLLKDGTEVPGSFEWNEDNTMMTFDPDDDLTEGDYTVILTSDALSTEGTNLLEDHTWDFSVSEDDSGIGFPIWWLAFGIILAVILLLVVFFVMRRGSKEEQYPEYQEEEEIDAVVEPRWHDLDVPPEEPWVQTEPPVDGEEVPEEEEPGQ